MKEIIKKQELLGDQFYAFKSSLPGLIDKIWSMEDYPEFLEALHLALYELLEDVVHLGETALESLEEDKSLETYILNFLWPEKAKSFLVLWRDIIFQQQKAHVLYLDEGIAMSDLEQLKGASKKVLLAAIEELAYFVSEQAESISRPKHGAQKALDQWHLQEPPFMAYAAQFEALKEQNDFLKKHYRLLVATAAQFEEIDDSVRQNMEQYVRETEEIKQYSAKVIKFLNNQKAGQFGNVTAYLEEKIEEINIREHLGDLIRNLDEMMSALPESKQIPVATNGGLINFRPINLQKSVRQWLDAEILPLLYKIEELSENIANGLKMALLNVRNKALIWQNEGRQPEIDVKELAAPIEDILETTQKYRLEFNVLTDTIDIRLRDKFKVSEVYDTEEDFLSVKLNSTVSQFQLDEYQWLTRIGIQLKEQWNKIGKFQQSVLSESNLSDTEKIVRFIQPRIIDVEQNTYTSIFQAKGYIGESFCVGRTAELDRIGGLIDKWKQNYRGAVILSGQRFSGKTLFGELVAKRFIQANLVRLNPKSTIQVGGRRFETTYDLGAALEFIRKYTINEKVLVWLDDLELWKDPSINFNQNVRALCRYIDNYSRQFFFLVSMSNWLKSHLSKIHEVEKVFQAEINLDTMSREDIREAILIRHGATQKILVHKNGQEIKPRQFRKLANTILKQTENNIGESLLHWAFSTKLQEDNKVLCDPNYQNRLPEFINADTGILLSALLIERVTSEYSLRQLFGLPFKQKYSGLLQRMMSVGLLSRYPDGSLEVNDIVVNDLGRMLERMNYLQFHYKS